MKDALKGIGLAFGLLALAIGGFCFGVEFMGWLLPRYVYVEHVTWGKVLETKEPHGLTLTPGAEIGITSARVDSFGYFLLGSMGDGEPILARINPERDCTTWHWRSGKFTTTILSNKCVAVPVRVSVVGDVNTSEDWCKKHNHVSENILGDFPSSSHEYSKWKAMFYQEKEKPAKSIKNCMEGFRYPKGSDCQGFTE